MAIKYNEFGEVISVNGITTGQHLGTPMQDAIAEKESDNQAYGTQLNTVGRLENCVEDEQPQSGGSGGSGGGVFIVNYAQFVIGSPDKSIDKTFDEILTALDAGQTVMVRWWEGSVDSTPSRYYNLNLCHRDGMQLHFVGYRFSWNYMGEFYNDGVTLLRLKIDSSRIVANEREM